MKFLHTLSKSGLLVALLMLLPALLGRNAP